MASGTIPQVFNNSGAGYCKMPDGTLIQWGSVTGQFTNGICSQNIAFPISFASVPSVTASISSTSTQYATANAITTSLTNCVVYMIMYGATTYTGGGNIMWTAIGRWK